MIQSFWSADELASTTARPFSPSRNLIMVSFLPASGIGSILDRFQRGRDRKVRPACVSGSETDEARPKRKTTLRIVQH